MRRLAIIGPAVVAMIVSTGAGCGRTNPDRALEEVTGAVDIYAVEPMQDDVAGPVALDADSVLIPYTTGACGQNPPHLPKSVEVEYAADSIAVDIDVATTCGWGRTRTDAAFDRQLAIDLDEPIDGRKIVVTTEDS